MSNDEVLTALGHLIGLTTGWNDAAIESYVEELRPLPNARALQRACDRIGRTWAEARRPPLATIIVNYNAEVARLGDGSRRLQEAGIEPRRGVEIAWKAYCEESRLLGKEPSTEYFGRIMKGITR